MPWRLFSRRSPQCVVRSSLPRAETLHNSRPPQCNKTITTTYLAARPNSSPNPSVVFQAQCDGFVLQHEMNE